MNRRQMFGAVAAIAAAGMFSAAYSTAQEHPKGDHHKAEKKTFKCMGGNACKGKSECGVAGAHTCHTKNACKGKGWVMTASEKECEDLKAANAASSAPKKS
ncbi:MAG: hypothetical protein HY900_18775 [Deltaproteobacteria bacterium]|nr:hypothetical protein [Deltaproteobacteria bacterium]